MTMQKLYEIHTKHGRFRLVDDCQLVFTPYGGKPYSLTVAETHKLLNLLYDYRKEIISTNLKHIQRVEQQHQENMSHAQQQRAQRMV